MADMDNFAEINDNFDTIKTLLNSIRAQGILNTSDVDKLLSGINAKLEKINTDEDVDLIKVFLTELKQTLDERHSVLISKFGAIEALFSNLLKNSNELPKSAELKELFDIVATNLSVFSREVVAQKESLNDISMRLDALRSDDSQKKDIIKNITLLKPDLERLNNGFDTIVISLNDNFKTLAKTISTFDKTEQFDKFSDSLNNIEMSSNALLSAIQLLDKKAETVDDSIKELATKTDLEITGKSISELKFLNQNLNSSVEEINKHYARIDVLADKIDASVNIIASLKSLLEDADDRNTKEILENIDKLKIQLDEVNDDSQFEAFKSQLTTELQKLSENNSAFMQSLQANSENVSSILGIIKALDINTNFSSLLSSLESNETAIKSYIDGKFIDYESVGKSNLTSIVESITTNADSLNNRINQTHSEMASICEGNFSTVFESISDLKKVVSQIDENGVSSNNAMFSNISDRLNLFETALKESLETQEAVANEASSKLCEQVENIKNLSGVLDYKMDSSVVEISNMTRMFETLKGSVDDVLALNFVETVKDLRADIYASRQDLTLAIENTGNGLSENLTNDLYGKYELIISKLDSVEDEFKKLQAQSLNSLKEYMEKISESLVDILTYVGESKEFPIDEIDKKIDGLSEHIKETHLGYIEDVRNVVDSIRSQIDDDLKNIETESAKRFDYIHRAVEINGENLKNDIKNSYDKLIELKTTFEELQSLIDTNSIDNNNQFDKLFSAAANINTEFESKLGALKTSLLDKVSEFQQDFTFANAEKVNEFKFAVENLYNKNSQGLTEQLEGLKTQFEGFVSKNTSERSEALQNIYDNFDNLKSDINNLAEDVSSGRQSGLENIIDKLNGLKEQVAVIGENNATIGKQSLDSANEHYTTLRNEISNVALESVNASNDIISSINENYDSIKLQLEKMTEENSGSRTNALAKLLENFVGLKDYVQTLNSKTAEELTRKTNSLLECFDSVKTVLNKVDENVDGDMTRQLSIIESNFESLIAQMTILNEKAEQSLVDKINDEYKNISSKIDYNVTQKLEEYKTKIEETFDVLFEKTQSQSSYLQERISDINGVMKSVWDAQSEKNLKQIDEISDRLKAILDDNIENTATDYSTLKEKLDEFTRNLSSNNEFLTQNLKAQLDDMTKYIDSVLDIQTQEADAHIDEFAKLIESINNQLNVKTADIVDIANKQLNVSNELHENINSLTEKSGNLENNFADLSDKISNQYNAFSTKQDEIKYAFDEQSSNLENRVVDLSGKISSQYNEFSTKQDEIKYAIDEKSAEFKVLVENINNSVNQIAISQMKAVDDSCEKLTEQVELVKQTLNAFKTFMSESMQNNLKNISKEIEKETDIIVGELVEQFDLIKKSQQDAVIQITSGIESVIEAHIYSNIEDLKSYLDIKTDSSVISDKLDNLKIEVTKILDGVISDLNKMLSTDVFTNALSDYRVANEILVNSAVDRANEKITELIRDTSTQMSGKFVNGIKDVENKLALFDKKFIDTLVDKYEEIKLISNGYNASLENVNKSINGLLSDFVNTKNEIDNRIDKLSETYRLTANGANDEIRKLGNAFERIRQQISNREFDEAFQASINKQLASLETMIKEQLSYVQDLNDLCEISLPDISEMNTIVKGAVLDKLDMLSDKIDSLDDSETTVSRLNDINNLLVSTANNISEQIEAYSPEDYINDALKATKTDIITQFLNIFNQISFVAEQEEIIDFIQARHDELITVLSHIVTTVGDISAVNENVTVVDSKINSLKDEIKLINEKITNIISSEGDIDYVYSLQDLESDIANLRIALKEMNECAVDYSSDFKDLMSSTEGVYKLVESIKDEIPDKKSFEQLTEDIVSISTRTNKLILASDESYKTLQDNLHDFKLVIDDLDERTRNFAQESGMDRIDSKLNALNTMVKNGAKTNQVFNQVFEYLAEWVDEAGTQISAISDKVETLDDIGQIKVMLADLKADAEDNSENVELIEELGNVFDKQIKKISSLETKLDKIIVENTINNQKNKLDLKPMEDTLNKFLAAIGDKISEQQDKINSMEDKLTKVFELIEEKDTAQLTKKVGGMDRQIAKLNKSIEKIASHVVEK